jgi:hypothetical protein
MAYPDTHRHVAPVSLGGVTLARIIEIINGYTVTFEDGQYAVNLVGANSNVGDVVNVNQVSVRSANSVGLQVVETAVSGLTPTESAQLDFMYQNEGGRWHIDGTQMVFYEDDNVTEIARFDLLDADGAPTSDPAAARQRVRV